MKTPPAPLTPVEKVAVKRILRAFKAWWQIDAVIEPGSAADDAALDELIEAFAEVRALDT